MTERTQLQSGVSPTIIETASSQAGIAPPNLGTNLFPQAAKQKKGR